MKRALILMLALLFTFCTIGCTISVNDEIKEPSSVSTVTERPVNDSIAPDSVATEIAEPQNSEENNPAEATPVPSTDASIEEMVVLDDSGIKITVKSIDYGGFFGAQLKMLIENNSGKTLTVQARDVSVNGYMVDTTMSAEVSDGKKINDSLTFMDSSFDLCGIKTIADIELKFHIFDSDSWDAYLDSDVIRIETSAFEGYNYTFDDTGTVAFENNGVKIVIKGLTDTSYFGPGIVVYIENTTDRNITVQVRESSINGFMIDGIFSCDVCQNKHAIDTITFFDSDLEDNGIESIENVELYFHIFDADSWKTIEDTEMFAITFN